MSISIELLDTAKRLLGGVSDYKLSQILGVKTAMMTKYRRGESPLSAEKVIFLCEMTSLDASEWLFRLYAERAKCDKEKAIFEELINRKAA